jgi:hypothetical protein
MHPAGFKPEIQASEQQQIQALDGMATDIGRQKRIYLRIMYTCAYIYIYIYICSHTHKHTYISIDI